MNVIGKVSLNLSFSSYMIVAFSVLLEVPIVGRYNLPLWESVVLNYKFIKFVIFFMLCTITDLSISPYCDTGSFQNPNTSHPFPREG